MTFEKQSKQLLEIIGFNFRKGPLNCLIIGMREREREREKIMGEILQILIKQQLSQSLSHLYVGMISCMFSRQVLLMLSGRLFSVHLLKNVQSETDMLHMFSDVLYGFVGCSNNNPICCSLEALPAAAQAAPHC